VPQRISKSRPASARHSGLRAGGSELFIENNSELDQKGVRCLQDGGQMSKPAPPISSNSRQVVFRKIGIG